VLGTFGAISPQAAAIFGIDEPLFAAEIGLAGHYERYPPDTEAHALPAFPAIERDISAVLGESVAWKDIAALVDSLALEHLEAVEFVTTFRGRQIGPQSKSLTLRLRFRAGDRTLTHDEIDPQAAAAMAAIESTLGGVIRK
jgi:phenylalanyl-tRNA synthetase beta chain